MSALNESEPLGQQPTTVFSFLTNLDPEAYPGALEAALSGPRLFAQEHGLSTRGDILLARKLCEVGAEYILEIGRRQNHNFPFPNGMGFMANDTYTKLAPEIQAHIDQAYAAIIFGLTVESMHEMLTDFTEGPAFFDRNRFFARLHEVTKGRLPNNITFEDVLRPDPTAAIDIETRSEKIPTERANILRSYVESEKTYDFILPSHEFSLPTSIKNLIRSNGQFAYYIFNGSTMDTKTTIQYMYHKLAQVALEDSEAYDILASLASEIELDPQRSPRRPAAPLQSIPQAFIDAFNDDPTNTQ